MASTEAVELIYMPAEVFIPVVKTKSLKCTLRTGLILSKIILLPKVIYTRTIATDLYCIVLCYKRDTSRMIVVL